MKIRIKGNSLRYRLTKTDVSQFMEKGYFEEITHFGETVFTYALMRSNGEKLAADFRDNKITLFIPGTMADEWAGTDRVGFEDCNASLYLLVEKDFKCLDNVAEDQSDNYPNPHAI